MAPVVIKFVVTFSSQDPKYPAENLLTENEAKLKKWLCAPTERSGILEGVFQLERDCLFSGMDIGNAGSATIQILVGKSSWPMSKDYVSLVSVSTLMTPRDARDGLNKTGVRMFKEADFNEDAAKEKWDRIKIKCTQHLKKDKPFGLAMIRIVAKDTDGMERLIKTPEPLKQTSDNSKRQYNTLPKNNKFASPSWKSASEFKRHFMKDIAEPERNLQAEAELKSKLLDLAGTGENGSSHKDSLSRTAKIVMAANGLTVPKYVKSPILTSIDSSKKKRPPSFEEEVAAFIKHLDPKSLDLENLTMADLRHKLEKMKCRKLSKDEKKYFFEKMQEYLENALEEQEESTSSNTPAKQSRPVNCDTPKTNLRTTPNVPKTPKSYDKSQNSSSYTPYSTGRTNGTGTISFTSSKTFSSPSSVPLRSPYQSSSLSQASETPVMKTPESQTKPRSRKRKEQERTPDTNDIWLSTTPDQKPHVIDISDGEDCSNERARPKKTATHGNLPNVIGSTPKGAKATAKKRRTLPSTMTSPRSTPGTKKNTVLNNPSMYEQQVYTSSHKAPPAPPVRPPSPDIHPSVIECPLCKETFNWDAIEIHAAICNGSSSSANGSSIYNDTYSSPPSDTSSVDGVPCPICQRSFPVLEIEEHADRCVWGLNSVYS